MTTDLTSAADRGPGWDAISRRALITSTASAVAMAPMVNAAQTRKRPKHEKSNRVADWWFRPLMIDPGTTLLDALREYRGKGGL
jgi:hypothetical protein